MIKIQPTQRRIIRGDRGVGHTILAQAPEIKRNDIVSLIHIFLDFGPVCRGRFAALTEPQEDCSFVSCGFMNVQQRHFKQFAMSQHIAVNRHASLSPTTRGFPSNSLARGRDANIFALMPIFHAAVTAIVICLREAASRSDLVLIEILFNYQHQGFCVAELENDLARSSALQGFARKLLYCWKSMPDWHLIEMVEKVECGFLILR